MDASEPPAEPPGRSEETGPDAVDALERHLLGECPRLTQVEVAERAGVPLEFARELWHLLGFAHTELEDRAFTDADVRALQNTMGLIDLGIVDATRQDGLVRTLGRSFARLAEWQVGLLADTAREGGVDPTDALLALAGEVLPRIEEVQTYVWRRHLLSVTTRLLALTHTNDSTTRQAVCFVDIVGYTSRSRNLTEPELVNWLEAFELAALDTVIEHRGRIIKNIGDELLIVTDAPEDAATIALELTRRGADPGDDFPSVRVGVAYGEVVTRLGDVFGPVVNIAARLTGVARPDTVLVDRGMYAALTGADDDNNDEPEPDPDDDRGSPYRLKRLRRVSVKGYSRLKVWGLTAR